MKGCPDGGDSPLPLPGTVRNQGERVGAGGRAGRGLRWGPGVRQRLGLF